MTAFALIDITNIIVSIAVTAITHNDFGRKSSHNCHISHNSFYNCYNYKTAMINIGSNSTKLQI